MASPLKLRLRNLAVRIFKLLGSDIRDERTGEKLGRGFLFAWRGRIHLLGLESAVIPSPIPQKRLTYWHQSIGFTMHPCPDFPRREPAISLLNESPTRNAPYRPLVVVLDHRDPETIQQLIARWIPEFCPQENLLLAYGGPTEQFNRIAIPTKIYIDDPRLRTRDHQREAQSYRAILREVSQWLTGRDFTHILFMESDHLPIAPDLLEQYRTCLTAESADVIGYQLERFDGTTHPHHLHALSAGWDSGETLSMLGTGHFWKREAWDAVATSTIPADLYLEMDLPTAAHRLGFRVRPLAEQEPYVRAREDLLTVHPAHARSAGAWTLHPVKSPTP